MSLNKDTLSTFLLSELRGPTSNPIDFTKAIQNALKNYVMPLMDGGGGSYLSGPGFDLLQVSLLDVFNKSYNEVKIQSDMCKQLSLKINDAFQTIKTQYSISIISVPSQLELELLSAFSSPTNNTKDFTDSFANAINNYVKSLTINWVIPGSPPITGAGPPSNVS